MRDYKAHLGPKGRKPARHGPFASHSSRAEKLPRRFQPLARPPAPPRPERPSRLRPWLERVRRVPLHGVLLGAALLWLTAGLAVGAAHLWQAPLREVVLAGNAAVSADAVLRLSGLRAGQPMHEVDPYALAARIAAHPRVVSADVRRLYPGRVAIRLRERAAELRIALRDGRTAVVDADNVVLFVQPPGAPAAEAVRHLPRITGVAASPTPGRPLHDAAVNRGRAALAALGELGFPEVERVVVEGGDPFLLTLRLPDGPRLVVPHEQLEPALRTYRALTERSPQALAGMETVDLTAVTAEGTGRIFLRRP